uniref:Pectinesterase inhibitor domain-containing protein n=1 Tax=Kalanchoe fedtschenkoi TaxID=63787 RepID=A0A7N0VG48_KALFE
MVLVVYFASTLFFALSAEATWLSRFSFFPSHLEIQAASFGLSPELAPSQAPSPASVPPLSCAYSPAQAPAPQSPSPAAQAPSYSHAPAPSLQAVSSSPSLSPSSSPSAAVSPDDPGLRNICDKTDYPALCRASVFPFLHSNFDHFSVLKLSIDACVNHTQAAIQKAAELANNPDTEEIIQVCQESYAAAMEDLKESASALAARDLITFRTKMSSVITSIGTCDETFGEDPEMESSSPLSAIDETITRLASNVIAIGGRL